MLIVGWKLSFLWSFTNSAIIVCCFFNLFYSHWNWNLKGMFHFFIFIINYNRFCQLSLFMLGSWVNNNRNKRNESTIKDTKKDLITSISIYIYKFYICIKIVIIVMFIYDYIITLTYLSEFCNKFTSESKSKWRLLF